MEEDIPRLNRKRIFRMASEARAAGVLYDRNDPRQEDCFRGSINRFCEIAAFLRGYRRVLDVGAGTGLLLSLLHHLGHECFALDVEDISGCRSVIFPSKIVEFTRCNVKWTRSLTRTVSSMPWSAPRPSNISTPTWRPFGK
jgi:hypothetical protein